MKLLAPLALGLAVLLAPLGARAASLDVSPIRVELSPRNRSAILALKNGGKEPVRVELSAKSWDETSDGKMVLGDTSELQVYPALQQLAPGEERKVRIGTTAAPGAREKTWRVFVTELPSAVQPTTTTAVRITTRIGVPVFLAPIAATTGAELAIARDGARLSVTLRNTGSVRIDPTEVKLALLGDGDAKLEEKTFSGWYVLAGHERIYSADAEPATCGRIRQVVATTTVETTRQVLARLPVPSGVCAP